MFNSFQPITVNIYKAVYNIIGINNYDAKLGLLLEAIKNKDEKEAYAIAVYLVDKQIELAEKYFLGEDNG
jgi:hypothetical protein